MYGNRISADAAKRQERVFARLRKKGGNVVTYFCTPDARVINFVVGPVSSERLLQEAKWSVSVYRNAVKTADGNPDLLRGLMRTAHRHKVGDRDLRRRGFVFRREREHYFLSLNPFPLIKDIQQSVFERLAGEEFEPPQDLSATSKTPEKEETSGGRRRRR